MKKPNIPLLKQVAQKACGGKYKMLYGGKIKKHQNGGPVKPGGKTQSGMLDKMAYKADTLASTILGGEPMLQMLNEKIVYPSRKTSNDIYKDYLALKTQTINPEDYMLPQEVARETSSLTNIQDMYLQKRNGGNIKIKESKKGTFTKAAKNRGLGVQEFASKVLANKDKYSTAMVKKAVFAQNFGGKKDLGGFLQNIAPLVSVIPGAAPIGTGLGLLGQLVGEKDQGSNVYSMKQMKLGGDFKQYNAPSHEQGGQFIDMNGNPTTSNPVAEIETDENSYDGYVYSDTLTNPDTGNTFAMDAKKIANKTKSKDQISQSSRILQLMKLREKNEGLRQQEENADIPVAENGLPYRDNNSLVPDLTIPLSTSSGVLPIYNQLPTRGGVEYGAREYPYNRDMMQLVGESQPTQSDEFYTVSQNAFDNTAATPDKPVDATTNLNPIAAGLKGASLAFGAYDALRGSEKEKLQLPNYSPGDQYYRDMNMDFAPALGEINMAATKGISDVSNQSGGIGARNSRVNAILARAGKSAASTQLQQQQANNQINAMIGQREDQKSNVTASERIRQQIAQSQNDANNRLAGRKFFSDLSQVGTSLNNIQYANDLMKNQNENQRQALEYGLTILGQKYPNFKPDPEFFNRLKAGTLTDADKPIFDQLVQYMNAR